LDVTPLSLLRVVYRDDQVVGVDIWENWPRQRRSLMAYRVDFRNEPSPCRPSR